MMGYTASLAGGSLVGFSTIPFCVEPSGRTSTHPIDIQQLMPRVTAVGTTKDGDAQAE
jgi:hypothetical protein